MKQAHSGYSFNNSQGRYQAVQFDSVEVAEDEMRPEQLPSLYGMLRLGKVIGNLSSMEAPKMFAPSGSTTSNSNTTKSLALDVNNEGLKVQPTM
ncbi:unnamed protein product [Strongylus vulgaris]|uniref:Uncharacterized protein n=1 Tax=Strongylus vulgaris TaxID=40348 RepID=A0A3P7K7V6_STRVU|nr:unnamed protein product [Strongylus vulgaris]